MIKAGQFKMRLNIGGITDDLVERLLSVLRPGPHSEGQGLLGGSQKRQGPVPPKRRPDAQAYAVLLLGFAPDVFSRVASLTAVAASPQRRNALAERCKLKSNNSWTATKTKALTKAANHGHHSGRIEPAAERNIAMMRQPNHKTATIPGRPISAASST